METKQILDLIVFALLIIFVIRAMVLNYKGKDINVFDLMIIIIFALSVFNKD